MKHLTLIMIALFFTIACCGTQKATKTQQEQIKNVTYSTEIPEDAKNDDGEIYELVEVVDNTGNTIGEAGSEKEAVELANAHKTADSVAVFYQKIKKRTLTEHQLWDELLEKYVSDDGNVNYSGIKKNHKDLLGYLRVLQISYEKINSKTDRTKNEILAYWINAYNALTIDLILRNHPTESIKDIKDPWDQSLWKFGEKWLSLNDIEHKILREMNEPRIHFAIVCASVSCPKLQNYAFTADKLEQQLTNATKEFLSDKSKNVLLKDHITISKIFKWFRKDFEQNGSLIEFLNQYSDVSISEDAKKSYTDYNWDLND